MLAPRSHPAPTSPTCSRKSTTFLVGLLAVWIGAVCGDSCEGFQELEYLGPYNASDHARLVEMYFGGVGDRVVYAQSGSCSKYKGCATAEYRSLYGCGAFSSTTGCIERGDGGELGDSSALIFDNCKNDQCILELSANATKCLLKTWWNDDLDQKAEGSCLSDADDAMLTESSFSMFDTSSGWGHCFLALPKGTGLSLQINCHEPGNVPRMKWTFRFPEILSADLFSCMLLSRCQNMDDPLDFLCLSGKSSVQTLRYIGESMRVRVQNDSQNLSLSSQAVHALTEGFVGALVFGLAVSIHFWY